jgi:single-stranded-DNA-specific exonuclease
LPHLIFVFHPSYDEGIVGLVAAKLVEEFYRPAIVGTQKGGVVKASARSIPSFNIVEAIAASQELLEDFGGHPLAAGLTVKKENFPSLKEKLERFTKSRLLPEDLVPGYRVDCEVDLGDLDWELWKRLIRFEPFGMGNPRPTFLTTGLKLTELRAVGNDGKHLKLRLDDVKTRKIERVEADFPLRPLPFDGIGFNLGFWETKLRPGEVVDLIYNLDRNVWNGRESLQLKVKDLRKRV